MALRKRSEVPVEQTWDLSLLIENEDKLSEACCKCEGLAQEILTKYIEHLEQKEVMKECLARYVEYREIFERAMCYTQLAASVDYTDSALQEICGKAQLRLFNAESLLSDMHSKMIALPEKMLLEVAGECPAYRCFIEDLIRDKKHTLSEETERVLSQLSSVFHAPEEIYQAAKLADIKFPDFVVEGKTYPLGYSMYEDYYEYLPQTQVRREANQAFYKKLGEYENVTAANYNSRVQAEKKLAAIRGFDSVFEYLLYPQKVELSMYHRQIDLVMEKLSVHMRKYAKLIQKLYGLDKMTYADLKIPLDPGFEFEVSREKAKEYVCEALSILGEDYSDIINRMFMERRIDVAQNKGKSTGGFCESIYQYGSFILMTWQGKVSDVITLAHEMGHAGHFSLVDTKQGVLDRDVSMYFVEAPSTMNELLLAQYLLDKSTDKRFKRFVLSCIVGNTYYHNFVTHFLEAAYQREVYRIIDKGGLVTADILSGIYKSVLEKFWGDAVELTPGCERTWMRQPHYYNGLYSYTYSAGLTVATQVWKRIQKEGAPAVEDWKKTLEMGSTLPPLELAKTAGVDISTEAPLLDTIETIGRMIDEIMELSKEL